MPVCLFMFSLQCTLHLMLQLWSRGAVLKGAPACFLHDLLQNSITNDVTTEKRGGATLKDMHGWRFQSGRCLKLQSLTRVPLHRRLIGSLFPFLRFFFPLSYGLFFLNSKCIFPQDWAAPVPTDKSRLPIVPQFTDVVKRGKRARFVFGHKNDPTDFFFPGFSSRAQIFDYH